MNPNATIADTLPTAETRGGSSLQRLVGHAAGQTSERKVEAFLTQLAEALGVRSPLEFA